jgi:hypothetical protein
VGSLLLAVGKAVATATRVARARMSFMVVVVGVSGLTLKCSVRLEGRKQKDN